MVNSPMSIQHSVPRGGDKQYFQGTGPSSQPKYISDQSEFHLRPYTMHDHEYDGEVFVCQYVFLFWRCSDN